MLTDEMLTLVGPVAFEVTGSGISIGCGDDRTFEVPDADVLEWLTAFSAARNTATGAGRLYAWRGSQTAGEVRKRWGVVMRGLTCVWTLQRSLNPGTVIAEAADAGKNRGAGWHRTPLQTAQLVAELTARYPAADRQLAKLDATIEDLWRWPAQRGYLVDQKFIAEKLAEAERVVRDSIFNWKVDLTQTDAPVHEWLRSWQIEITDQNGYPSLDSEHHSSAVVPHKSERAWAEFQRIRKAGNIRAKLTEIKRATVRGRIHPQILSIGAKTGRQASKLPALQNVTPSLRQVLLPDPGHVLIGVDLDRVEPRVICALSGDPALRAAVEGDIYQVLADRIGVDRSTAKTTLLAMMYGEGAGRLSRKLGIEVTAAKQISQNLLAGYPTMAAWRQEVSRNAIAGKELRTGYERLLPPTPLDSKRPGKHLGYMAVNWVVQGTAADVFKRLTIAAAERLPQDALWLPIHDELLVQVPAADAEATRTVLAEVFSTTFRGVPITGTPTAAQTKWVKTY